MPPGRAPRLQTLKPRLSGRPQRLKPAARREAERLAEEPWRDWYRTARWRALRLEILERDRWTCQATGVKLAGKYPEANSPVIDHIQPHYGLEELFWDPANLQALSRAAHDGWKQRKEAEDQRAAAHPSWLRPSAAALTIVCGPPAGGKSAYVAGEAATGDIVIDLDRIAARLSGEGLHDWDRSVWLRAALYKRNLELDALAEAHGRRAWFIVSEPTVEGRDFWRRTLQPQALVMVFADLADCQKRIRQRGGPRVQAQIDYSTTWHVTFEADPRDTLKRGG